MRLHRRLGVGWDGRLCRRYGVGRGRGSLAERSEGGHVDAPGAVALLFTVISGKARAHNNGRKGRCGGIRFAVEKPWNSGPLDMPLVYYA